RDHLLDELVLGDGHAEGLALLRVAHRGVEAGADQPGGAGRHGIAPALEGEHGDPEPLALLADPVGNGHLDILHVEAARVARQDAPLLLHGVRAEALEAALHDEGAEAAVIPSLLLLLIGPRDHQEVVRDVGEADPRLLTVHDVAIAFARRRRLDAHRVRARVGLGQAVAGDSPPPRLGPYSPSLSP